MSRRFWLFLGLAAAAALCLPLAANPHFRFGSGEMLVHIQRFDRDTGLLVARDYAHNLNWEMVCGLDRDAREGLIAAPGLGVKMRFQRDEHTVELRLGRLQPGNGKYELEWIEFTPERMVLL